MLAADKKWLARQYREEAAAERGLGAKVLKDPELLPQQAAAEGAAHRITATALTRLADRLERSIDNPRAQGSRT